ncbi:tyrosine-type recombinase/integrase [Nocardioides luteus]|uniref:tyrosine-type recombinase/integrase n=1 Tax=Nocardioides luteus TaxID=1844 RepID=UPI0018CB9FE7|nr:site-specific integrase [Nocardioides luteus]MBG6098316.1 integrase [Nocardioides luteus]
MSEPLKLGEHGKVATFRERGKPYARVKVRLWSGTIRPVKRSGKTYADATRRVLDAVRDLLEQGGGPTGLTKASTFRQAHASWLASFTQLVEKGKRAESSLALYTTESERVVLPAIGDLRLGEITTPVVERFIQGVVADKGASTAKVCKSVVSNTCSHAVRQGGMTSNPVHDLTPIEATKKRKAKALRGKEIKAWLDAIDASDLGRRKDYPDLARFMLATGVRIGEALAVTWADLDLAAGTVKIEHTAYRVTGKGVVLRKVKSVTSDRALLIPSWCVSMLKERRKKMRAFDGPVFPDAKGGFRDRNNVQRDIRNIRKGTDFEWLTTHTYRKTVASTLDEAGISGRQVADQLGHSRVSMTQDTYLDRRPVNENNLRALEAIDPDATDRDEGDAGEGETTEEAGS